MPRARGRDRQIQFHSSAMAELAFDPEIATALLDEAIGHAQAQARTVAGGLRGEERFSGTRKCFGRHPAPGVADTKDNVVTRSQFC